MSFSVPTGLFDFEATQIGDLSDDAFTSLKTNGLTGATLDLFTAMKLPEKINLETAKIKENENVSDLLVLIFDKKSKNGLFFVQGKGVWSISGTEYTWAGVQALDLWFSFRDDGSVQIDALK